jgi:hypothetical protein
MRWLAAALLVVAGSAGAAEVTLKWDANAAEDEVTEYVVYLGGGEVARTGETTLAMDIEPGAHVFEVSAVNRWGESVRSDPAVTPPKASPPQMLTVTVTVTVTVQ